MSIVKVNRIKLDSRAKLLKPKLATIPAFGWIRNVRQALGMSQKDLAKKLGVNPKTIHSLEVNEIKNKIQIESLKKLADALDCDFYYGFIPRKSLEATYELQARKNAEAHLERVMNTMALEKQSVEFPKSRIEEIVKEILESESVKW